MIAEVASRITSVDQFKKFMKNIGFELLKESAIKDYFYIYVFKKKEDCNKKRVHKLVRK